MHTGEGAKRSTCLTPLSTLLGMELALQKVRQMCKQAMTLPCGMHSDPSIMQGGHGCCESR